MNYFCFLRRILEGFKTDWNNQFDEQNKIYHTRNSQKNNFDELKIIRRANLIVILFHIDF